MQIRSAECSITLQAPDRGYWTDGDSIQGTVHLDVRRDIEVQTITVDFKGGEYAAVSWDSVDLNFLAAPASVQPNYATQFSEFINMEKRVWPGTDIADYLQSNEHRIGKGHHEFAFRFDLPLDMTRLPSSFTMGQNNGYIWSVNASVNRPTKLKNNYTANVPIAVFPRRYPDPASVDLDQNLNTSQAIDVNAHIEGAKKGVRGLFDRQNREKVHVELNVCIGDTLPHFHPFECVKTISAGVDTSDISGIVMVSHLTLSIIRAVTTTIDIHRDFFENKIVLADKDCHLVLDKQTTDITGLFNGVPELTGITENSETQWHSVKHSLFFELTIASVHKPDSTRQLNLHVPVSIYSIAAEELPPPNYHDPGMSIPQDQGHSTNAPPEKAPYATVQALASDKKF